MKHNLKREVKIKHGNDSIINEIKYRTLNYKRSVIVQDTYTFLWSEQPLCRQQKIKQVKELPAKIELSSLSSLDPMTSLPWLQKQ